MIVFTPYHGLWPAHKPLFKQRIRFGKQEAQLGPKNQPKGSQFVPVDGPEFVPAQSAPPKRGNPGSEPVVGDSTRVLVGKVWTIPGRLSGVQNGYQLQEIDADGNVVGVHDILTIDPHGMGLHTLIETKLAK